MTAKTTTKTKYRLTIGHDEGMPDPISESDLFALHMFSTRLINYTNPDELLGCQYEYPEKLDDDGYVIDYAQRCGFMPTNHPTDHAWVGPEGFMVSYFEHGSSKYGLAGSMTGMPDFRWDGVEFAGFLEITVPDDEREWWDGLDDDWKREIAAGILDSYTAWANGEVFWYSIQEMDTQTCDLGYTHKERLGFDDSCGGFIGWDWFVEAVSDAMPDDATPGNVEMENNVGYGDVEDFMPKPNCDYAGCLYRAQGDGKPSCVSHHNTDEGTES